MILFTPKEVVLVGWEHLDKGGVSRPAHILLAPTQVHLHV